MSECVFLCVCSLAHKYRLTVIRVILHACVLHNNARTRLYISVFVYLCERDISDLERDPAFIKHLFSSVKHFFPSSRYHKAFIKKKYSTFDLLLPLSILK